MYEKFGEFDSWEEINKAAQAQLEEGDLDAIKEIAKENGLDPEDVEDFCTGTIEELTTPTLAAIGKLDAEAKDLKIDGGTEGLEGFPGGTVHGRRADEPCRETEREITYGSICMDPERGVQYENPPG